MWDAKAELLLKVSKSQKYSFLKLNCPKMNEILDKILPYEARAEFCSSITFIFWAMEFKEKNTFEIY